MTSKKAYQFLLRAITAAMPTFAAPALRVPCNTTTMSHLSALGSDSVASALSNGDSASVRGHNVLNCLPALSAIDATAVARTRLVDLGELADAAPTYMSDGFPLVAEVRIYCPPRVSLAATYALAARKSD